MTEKRRWKEMDILRGMAILMVLLYHSVIVFPRNLHEIEWCRTLHTFLWTVQMPLFFLVSGFCYSFRGNYREYALRKCRRILVPHIVFSFLDIMPRLLPNPFVNEQMDVREAVVDFVLYGGSDWFLWTLFVIAMIFPAFDALLTGKACRREGSGGPARAVWPQKAAVFLIVLLFLAKPYMTDFLLFNMVCQYLWYFFLGYGLRKRADTLLPAICRFRNLLPGGAVMIAAFAGLCVWTERGGSEVFALLLEVVCVFGSFVFFLGLAALCCGKISDFLALCGVWSLQMYLLDAYALVATRTVLVSVLNIENPAAIIAGNFILDTVIVLAVSRYVLTKAKVFRICCGIREKG